jgi:hypothetical protein
MNLSVFKGMFTIRLLFIFHEQKNNYFLNTTTPFDTNTKNIVFSIQEKPKSDCFWQVVCSVTFWRAFEPSSNWKQDNRKQHYNPSRRSRHLLFNCFNKLSFSEEWLEYVCNALLFVFAKVSSSSTTTSTLTPVMEALESVGKRHTPAPTHPPCFAPSKCRTKCMWCCCYRIHF